MSQEKKLREEVNRKGPGLQKQLDEHFKQWNSGMEYRNLFPPLSKAAKNIGVSLMEYAYAFQDEGYIRLFNTPNGKKFVYSSNCPLTTEEINSQLMDLQAMKESF